MEVTKREILFSIIIVLIMLCAGFLISNGINTALLDKYQEYDTAVQIDNDKELFEYGMRTDVGRAFVYGKLKAVDTVSYPDIKGEYSYVSKTTERYTEHTRTVTREDDDGNTYTETEIYYSWDYVSSESKHSKKISFLDVEFDYGTVRFPGSSHIDTVYKGSSWWHNVGDLRFKYSGAPTSSNVTIYAQLEDNTIKNVDSHLGLNIEETIKGLESKWQLFLFWFFWVILTAGAVVGFYYIDNRWLEDSSA